MKITRIYIHNLACFSNFEFVTNGVSPLLVIGKNGTGKSSLLEALLILQGIARTGITVQQAFGVPAAFNQSPGLVRLAIDMEVQGVGYGYQIAISESSDRKSFCVQEESLTRDGRSVFDRNGAAVSTYAPDGKVFASFSIETGLFALPVIQSASFADPVYIVRTFLASVFILQPIPSLMGAEANESSGVMVKDCKTFASWLVYMLASWPAAYGTMERYLKTVFPDFKSLITLGNVQIGKNYFVQFEQDGKALPLLLSKLSNGEKCQLVAAAMMGVNAATDGVVCVWDEPTNYLALNEVAPMMAAMCSSFKQKGQLLVMAHSDEAILQFSDESTYVFSRKTHLDPVLPPRTLADLRQRKLLQGDLATALRLGDVEYGD